MASEEMSFENADDGRMDDERQIPGYTILKPNHEPLAQVS